jgi:hypothetical protein
VFSRCFGLIFRQNGFECFILIFIFALFLILFYAGTGQWFDAFCEVTLTSTTIIAIIIITAIIAVISSIITFSQIISLVTSAQITISHLPRRSSATLVSFQPPHPKLCAAAPRSSPLDAHTPCDLPQHCNLSTLHSKPPQCNFPPRLSAANRM